MSPVHIPIGTRGRLRRPEEGYALREPKLRPDEFSLADLEILEEGLLALGAQNILGAAIDEADEYRRSVLIDGCAILHRRIAAARQLAEKAMARKVRATRLHLHGQRATPAAK